MTYIDINIAAPGNPTTEINSRAGHIWITKPDGSSTGYAPGGQTKKDNAYYKPGYISVRVPITDEQAALLNTFDLDKNGFGENDYNVLSNSCIDYIWALLHHIGLNPDNYEGRMTPVENIMDFMALPGAELYRKRPYSPEENGMDVDDDQLICTPLPPAMPTPPLDPLALDLNSDGIISTLAQENGVHFDLDNSGFAEKTGWVAPEDGLLILDRNGNNQIDGGNELFGTETTLVSGQKATNGFEALKEFDQNGDGKIDGADDVYQNLKIWQDKNSNGRADEGELFTLAELSVASIGVNYKNQKFTDGNGTLHQQSGLFIRDDGSSGVTNTLFFENDRRDSIAVDNSVVVRDEIKALPNAKGYGNLPDLHQAMALDESGYLRSLVEAFVQENDADHRNALTYQILVYWTGQQNTDPVVRGNYIDGQHLGILETVWGQTVSQQRPTQAYAKQLNEIYAGLELSLYAQLRAGSDTLTKNLLKMSIVGQENNTLLTDFSSSCYYFTGSFISDSTQAAVEFQDFTRVLNGLSAWDGKILAQFLASIEEATAGNEALLYTIMNALHSEAETFIGSGADDIFRGYNGDDKLYGNAGNDVLYGDEGNDVLDGGSGNDILHGGTGDDVLEGDYGSDTYLFNAGDGQDSIYERYSSSGDVDVLRFGEGIRPEDIRLSRTSGYWSNLILSVAGTQDSVTIKDFFFSSRNQVEQIAFADGTVWDVGTVKAMLLTGTDDAQTLRAYSEGSEIHAGGGDDLVYGAEGNDVMYGAEGNDVLDGDRGNDVLEGGSGNDTLTGGNGNDILHGGTGNDVLEGDYGSDTYLFNTGDGQDTIYERYSSSGDVDVLRFGEGIRPEDIRLSRTSGYLSNLILSVAGTQDSVTIKDFFFSSRNQVEQIAFADGTVWDVGTVKAMLLTGTDDAQTLRAYSEGSEIHAGGGDDVVYGAGGNDVMYGAEGNDVLDGDRGNDVLEGGSGNDTLTGGNGNDILYGGTGNDVLEGDYGSDTYLFNTGDGQDTIYERYTSSGDVDVLRFGEGIRPEDIRLSRTSGYLSNLILSVAGTQDSVTIKDFFFSSRNQVEQIAFADGTVWDVGTVKAMLLTGTDDAQTLRAYSEGSEIHAGGGDDVVYGAGGNDVMYGAEGNDVLDGDRGNDVLEGGSGNDTLTGGSGNDILYGGTGNDVLEGDYGSDTYLFNAGDGQDSIYERYTSSGDVDVLRFGEGIRPEDIRLSRTSGYWSNLILSVAGTQDSVTIKDFFYYSRNQIEHITFTDGTDWLVEDILNYLEDDIPLPLAAPEDAPVPLSLVHELMVQFTAGDNGDEDDAVVTPSLTTARSSVNSLVNYV